AGEEPCCHTRQLLLNESERCDRPAELRSLLRVPCRLLQRTLGTADAARAKFETTNVEYVERDSVSFADFAEHILARYFGVVQDYLARRRRLDAHLLLFVPKADTGELAFDQKRSELIPIDLGEDREQIGETSVRDELLGSVEKIVPSIVRERRARARRQGIRAGI